MSEMRKSFAMASRFPNKTVLNEPTRARNKHCNRCAARPPHDGHCFGGSATTLGTLLPTLTH